jgi:hypothetical protein
LTKGMENAKPKPGDTVVLTSAPPGLLKGLPTEDQDALTEAVGKPVLLLAYDDDGRAELEFKDRHGVIHFIYVNPDMIRAAKLPTL